MGVFIVTLELSSHDVVLPISNLVPKPPGTLESPIPGRAASSPEKSNTKNTINP